MNYVLLLSIFAVVSLNTFAQCPYGGKEVPILLKNPFKINVVTGVSSGTARVADYVEFKTMEKIYSREPYPKVVFDKDTPIYAVVTRRKHRHFPLVRGKLEIALKPLVDWDGHEIEIGIARHGKIVLSKEESEKLSEQNRKKELDNLNKARNKPCKVERANCVAGRGNAAVAPIVPAFAASSAAAIAAIAEEDETRFIAATAFFSIAKELGDLLNGTDVVISENEIFDLHIREGSTICQMPELPKPSETPTPKPE